MKRPREAAARWLKQAEHDLGMARRLAEESPADACYFAEQAAQKALNRYPDALADPAVPFESYSLEQAAEAIRRTSAILDTVRPKITSC